MTPPPDDSWLQPLRAYPAWMVLACAAVSLTVAAWVLVTLARWALYVLAALTVAGALAALWLWL